MRNRINKAINIIDKKEKERAIFFLSFLLPLIMIGAILISKHVYPFGDRCILRTDFYHQYLPFHAELQNKLKHFESLFYTFKVGLGTSFITLLAYYLVCPFNILLLIVGVPSQVLLLKKNLKKIFPSRIFSQNLIYFE